MLKQYHTSRWMQNLSQHRHFLILLIPALWLLIFSSTTVFAQDIPAPTPTPPVIRAKPQDQSPLTMHLKILENATRTLAEDMATPYTDQCVPSESMVLPSPDELGVLYELAILGNMDLIRKHPSYLKHSDPRYVSLAQTLQNLATAYEEEYILALVTQWIGERQ